jgi:hypothetical protein
MKNSLVAYLLTSIATFGFAPDHLNGLKIKFDWGEDETSIVEFTEFAAYEMDDESGTNRVFAGDYDADTEGDTVKVTLFGQDGANDVFTLNFTTEATGNGNLQDFEYLQPGEEDDTFRPTNEANIYLDLIGSGDFRFDVLNHSDETHTEYPIDRNDFGSALGLAPLHLDGFKIKFDWGEEETSIIEFTEYAAYEMDDESGTNRVFAGDYDADTEGDTITITIFSQFDASDVYKLSFTTAFTGSGRLDDYVILQPGELDDTFRPTNEENIYLDLIGSGDFRFDVLSGSNHSQDANDSHGSIHDYNSTEPHHEEKLEFESIPVSEVESFVAETIGEFPELLGSNILRAEKIYDAVKTERFAYEVVLDRGISLYFDADETFRHAALSGEFSESEIEFIKEIDQAFGALTQFLNTEFDDVSIIEIEKEFSILEKNDYIYNVIFEREDLEYIAHISGGIDQIILITLDDEEGFAEEWRPVELPDDAKDFLLQTYPELVDATANYHSEQRPTPNGQGKEFVAFLEDGTEVIFDANGTFAREFNPFKDFQQNLDAGLKFDAERSSNLSGATVHIQKIENSSDVDFGSMLYRISLTNSEVSAESSPSLQQMELSQKIDAEQELTLTFTYEMGPPRFFIVSGSDVSAFKHRMPEWDKPGSFTLKAKTISPVKTDNNDLSLTSTLGITVEMGGERFYEGTIFETQLINQDVGVPAISSPWDPAASFKVNAVPDTEIGIWAYIPRRLLSGHYGIMDPDDVRAAVIDENGSLKFCSGMSVENPEDDMQFTGVGFSRTPYKGFEPRYDDFAGPNLSIGDEGSAYLLDEEEFDHEEGEEDDHGSNYPESPSNDEEIAISKFDFDGDGFANSFLKVRFFLSPTSTSFPLEVQVGDPFVDPFANLDDSQFGSVSGTVTDGEGKGLEEYDVWFFKVPESGHDLYSGEPAFFDFERGADGSFVASLPPGSYHAEAFAYDFKTDTPYKPQLAGGFNSPTVFTIVDSTYGYHKCYLSPWKRNTACLMSLLKSKARLQLKAGMK